MLVGLYIMYADSHVLEHIRHRVERSHLLKLCLQAQGLSNIQDDRLRENRQSDETQRLQPIRALTDEQNSEISGK
jgi:hypothetical protein